MKKFTAWVILLTICVAARCQVIVNMQLPPLGLSVKQQLWSLSLVNTGNPLNVQVEMTMTDVTNNLRVLTGTTRIFALPQGVKQLQLSDVMPVVYNVGAPGYAVNASADGFLPIGVFNICYTVTKFNNDAVERMTEECETVQVEPLSPPQLILPANREHVDVTRPVFVWLPPSPFNLFTNLLYDWSLVEVQPTQNAASAIQQNIPLLAQQNISYTSLQYPLSAPALDSSKLYAWRVVAKNGSSTIATSESWLFKIKIYGRDSAHLVSSGYYSKLKRDQDASYAITTGVVRYEYLNEINNNNVSIHVYDISSSNRQPLSLDSMSYKVKYGQNFQQLDLTRNSLQDQHIYLLELINARLEHWYLKFEYRRPNK